MRVLTVAFRPPQAFLFSDADIICHVGDMVAHSPPKVVDLTGGPGNINFGRIRINPRLNARPILVLGA